PEFQLAVGQVLRRRSLRRQTSGGAQTEARQPCAAAPCFRSRTASLTRDHFPPRRNPAQTYSAAPQNQSVEATFYQRNRTLLQKFNTPHGRTNSSGRSAMPILTGRRATISPSACTGTASVADTNASRERSMVTSWRR